MTAARHEQIADELRQAIGRGEYATGDQLPSESELATRHHASRGTVRQALATLSAEGLVGSRQGARRVVLGGANTQSFTELRSFAQWARSTGREATGQVIQTFRRPATDEDIDLLGLAPATLGSVTEVLTVLRLRCLDGEPVLVERTVYADWIADAVERIEPDCPSVTERLYQDVKLVVAHGRHLIDAVAAGTRDAELLGVRRGSPLLRVRRVTTTHTGRPVEWSDDRYRAGSITFAVHNAIGATPE